MPRFHQVDFMQSSPSGRTLKVRAFDDDADGQEVGQCIVEMDWWDRHLKAIWRSGRISVEEAYEHVLKWARTALKG